MIRVNCSNIKHLYALFDNDKVNCSNIKHLYALLSLWMQRDLVICSHDILASKRDSLAVSMPVCRRYLSHEVSSESATTSLKGHTDGSRSCSEAMQKSDDVTVDSALSAKKCMRLPLSMDNDQRTDDSSTSQHLPTPKLADRVSFGGKQIPIRAAMACRNFSQRGEKRLKSRKVLDSPPRF